MASDGQPTRGAVSILGVVSVYATVAHTEDVVSFLLIMPFSLLPLVLGVLFVRRSRSL